MSKLPKHDWPARASQSMPMGRTFLQVRNDRANSKDLNKRSAGIYLEFIKDWEKSKNLAELIEKRTRLGQPMSTLAASRMAARLRKQGVKLKRFKTNGEKTDYKALEKFRKHIAKEKE